MTRIPLNVDWDILIFHSSNCKQTRFESEKSAKFEISKDLHTFPQSLKDFYVKYFEFITSVNPKIKI